jgi:hypothetical protein
MLDQTRVLLWFARFLEEDELQTTSLSDIGSLLLSNDLSSEEIKTWIETIFELLELDK